MKDALTGVLDERQAEDDELLALDDFEMLVLNTDIVNDLEKLGIWQLLHNLLLGTSDTLKMQTLSITIPLLPTSG